MSKKKWDGIERRKSLRVKAESLIKSLEPKPSAQAMEILMHELMVHKVELEMQNEELKNMSNLMEDSRDRYMNLYEFAPVGFITVSRDGLIREINLTACTMLGVDRFRVMSTRFANFIASRNKDHWHRLFMYIMEHSENKKKSFDIEMIRQDGSVLMAYLNCAKKIISESATEMRISMTDISEMRAEKNE